MMDDAAFLSENSLVKDVFVVTASFSIHMLKPVTDRMLIPKDSVKTQVESQIIDEAALFDDEENVIATGSGSFIKTNIKLSKDMGYL